jgi:hypothetical protein
MMNPVTGHWVGGVDDGNGEAESPDAPPDKTPPQRIVPYVEDRRNVLIVRPHGRLGVLEAETLATLQYALKRGIEAVYQLEESELMAEPLPTRDNRQSILLYRGGRRRRRCAHPLGHRADALARGAKALRSCTSSAPPAVQPGSEKAWSKNWTTTASRIAKPGCYKLPAVVLQPARPRAHRPQRQGTDGLALDMLCRLTRGPANQGTQGRSPEQHAVSWPALRAARSSKPGWTMSIRTAIANRTVGQHTIPRGKHLRRLLLRRLNLAVFIDGPHHEATPSGRWTRSSPASSTNWLPRGSLPQRHRAAGARSSRTTPTSLVQGKQETL